MSESIRNSNNSLQSIENSLNSEESDLSDNSKGSQSSLDLQHITDYHIAKEKPKTVFSPECIRKRSNWSTMKNEFKMDHPHFNPGFFLKDMPNFSPKMVALLNKIKQLDTRDEQKYGKTFKHFIFSDIKSGGQGAKMLASGLLSSGWNLAYKSELKNRDKFEQRNKLEERNKKIEPQWGPLELLSQRELITTRKNNFYLLSSVPVFEKPISVRMKKEILSTFNSRPENIYGDLARIIVMDSGFKEGIDLFDIKYVHIFEPSMNLADQKQVIGRGTRTCGQKGLEFHPTQGWPLEVFIYDLEIPEKLRFSLLGADTAYDLLMRAMNADVRLANFGYDIERLAVAGSVDYALNQNVHNFKVDLLEEDAEEIVLGGVGSEGRVSEGRMSEGRRSSESPASEGRRSSESRVSENKKGSRISIQSARQSEESLQPVVFGHKEMVKYIEENFSQFSWENVKMENQCGEIPEEWKDWYWESIAPASERSSESRSSRKKKSSKRSSRKTRRSSEALSTESPIGLDYVCSFS